MKRPHGWRMLLTTPEAGRVEWQKSLNAFVASLLLGAKIDPQKPATRRNCADELE